MKRSGKNIIFVAVTVILAVAVSLLAGYIMINRLGLVEGYDFGLGAYYYVDIPDFEKIVDQDAYEASVPVWVHIVLFAVWGWLMWRLWLWIDKKMNKDNGDESEH